MSLRTRETTCRVLGVACVALTISGCAALKNFPGKEGGGVRAAEPPPALRPPQGEPAPSPPVTAQAPRLVRPPPTAAQTPPPPVAAAPPAQPYVQPTAPSPTPPVSLLAYAPLTPGMMPSLPMTQIDDRLLAPDLENEAFSLKFTQSVAIQDLLPQLVHGTSLTMILDPGISGAFIGDLKNVTMRQAFALLLQPLGLAYTIDGRFIRVFKRDLETRLFDINDVAAQRTGIATRGAGAGGDNTAQASRTIATDLFADLTKGGLLSERATFNLDRKAGLLQVTDFPERLDRVAVYLDTVHNRVHRQVQIDVRVVEVELKNAAAQTIDWNAVNQSGATSGAGRVAALTSVRVTDVARLLTALEEQGKVSTIAGTRMLARDNEPAIVRSGLGDQTRQNGATASETSVTDGLALMVKPQIGSDGSLMLSLSPTLTQPTQGEAKRAIGSLGVVDILARLTDGETIVVSGFARLLQERDTGTGAARNRRSTDLAGKRSDVLILLTPRILGSPAD